MSENTVREAFRQWARENLAVYWTADERIPSGMLGDWKVWQAAWTASRKQAMEEAAQVVDAELALWAAETGDEPTGLTSSNNVNISLKRSASNIRQVKDQQ